jgi:Gpi18-like mannosyltransferase
MYKIKQFFKNVPFKYILILFIGLRLLTFLAAVLGLNFLDFKFSFPYVNVILEKYGSPLLWSWANFDGVHYLSLADQGYNFDLTQAYFPAYFLLINFISIFINNFLFSGLLISHIFFFLSLVILYKLLRFDYNDKVSRKILLYQTFFLTSFFFLSIYTESLYLFLTLSSFYLLRKKAYIKSGLIAALASATRITGIFLVPIFFIEIFLENKSKLMKKKTFINQVKMYIKTFWPTFLPALGLLAYMHFLKQKFDDPFMFVHVQSGFGGGRDTSKLVLFYQVIWRYIKMLITVDRSNPIYYTLWLEFLTSFYFIGLIIFGFFKKVRPSYLIYSLLCFILPTLTGVLSSMPRYLLVLFPAFICIELIPNNKLKKLLFIINIILLFINTALFTRGYWIS